MTAKLENAAVIYGKKGKIIVPDFVGGSKFLLYDNRGSCKDTIVTQVIC